MKVELISNARHYGVVLDQSYTVTVVRPHRSKYRHFRVYNALGKEISRWDPKYKFIVVYLCVAMHWSMPEEEVTKC